MNNWLKVIASIFVFVLGVILAGAGSELGVPGSKSFLPFLGIGAIYLIWNKSNSRNSKITIFVGLILLSFVTILAIQLSVDNAFGGKFFGRRSANNVANKIVDQTELFSPVQIGSGEYRITASYDQSVLDLGIQFSSDFATILFGVDNGKSLARLHCTDSDMKILLDNGIKINLQIYDDKGTFIKTLEISPRFCELIPTRSNP